jgi:hypothetical protein
MRKRAAYNSGRCAIAALVQVRLAIINVGLAPRTFFLQAL